mmetsp:Transcript_14216/g.33855  ORF Transcript_14216/g.33855 Transcript_14216/m.33855 type:complete len:238 (+) Transcript_14216:145-858(+)
MWRTRGVTCWTNRRVRWVAWTRPIVCSSGGSRDFDSPTNGMNTSARRASSNTQQRSPLSPLHPPRSNRNPHKLLASPLVCCRAACIDLTACRPASKAHGVLALMVLRRGRVGVWMGCLSSVCGRRSLTNRQRPTSSSSSSSNVAESKLTTWPWRTTSTFMVTTVRVTLLVLNLPLPPRPTSLPLLLPSNSRHPHEPSRHPLAYHKSRSHHPQPQPQWRSSTHTNTRTSRRPTMQQQQ